MAAFFRVLSGITVLAPPAWQAAAYKATRGYYTQTQLAYLHIRKAHQLPMVHVKILEKNKEKKPIAKIKKNIKLTTSTRS